MGPSVLIAATFYIFTSTLKIINNTSTPEKTFFFLPHPKCHAFPLFKMFNALYRYSRDITMFREAPWQPILQPSNWKLLSHFVHIGFHVTLQSMWDSTVSTMTWLWAGRSAQDLPLLQNNHTCYITHTFIYSFGTTGSIPESGKGTCVTTHLHLLRR